MPPRAPPTPRPRPPPLGHRPRRARPLPPRPAAHPRRGGPRRGRPPGARPARLGAPPPPPVGPEMVDDGEALGQVQLQRRTTVAGLGVVVVDQEDDVDRPLLGQYRPGGPEELAAEPPPAVLRFDLQPPDDPRGGGRGAPFGAPHPTPP